MTIHSLADPQIGDPGHGLLGIDEFAVEARIFRATLGGYPAVEHQGRDPGFDSQIFLAPCG